MPKRDKRLVSYNMSRIKGKNTSIEKILRHALTQAGYRYRVNDPSLPDHPDIVFKKAKIAIFCDGDFFHGYDFPKIDAQLKTNKEFWEKKILTNQERDRKEDQELVEMGYLVLHFWEHEIRNDLGKVVSTIEDTLYRRNQEKEEEEGEEETEI